MPIASMFRDGQYLEVIKASDDCLATAVVTVQERTVEIKKRKIVTNKWLQTEDWAALYKILEKAILRNSRADGSHRECRDGEWRKSTRKLDVTYTFEPSECTNDVASLPTIKVHVSPARKKSAEKREAMGDETLKKRKLKASDTPKPAKEKKFSHRMIDTKQDRLKKTTAQTFLGKHENSRPVTTEWNDLNSKRGRKYTLSDDLQNVPLEEYIPDAPRMKEPCPDFKYVPSKKSTLESMEITRDNEYTPTLSDNKYTMDNVNYIPNSIEKLETTYEIYEPSATTLIPDNILEKYIPNSKGIKPSIEEYEPDFKIPSKLMKFDDSYIPSSVRQNDSAKTLEKSKHLKIQRLEAHRKGKRIKKKINLSQTPVCTSFPLFINSQVNTISDKAHKQSGV